MSEWSAELCGCGAGLGDVTESDHTLADLLDYLDWVEKWSDHSVLAIEGPDGRRMEFPGATLYRRDRVEEFFA